MTSQPIPSPAVEGPDDEFLIEDLQTMELLNDPVRSTLLQLLIFDARSVRDLAEELDVPVTRLYYHINLLEEAGVIRVVATRKAGAMIQKLYQATARTYRPSPSMIENIEDPREAARIGAATVLDTARVDIEQALAAHFTDPTAEHHPIVLGRTILRLPAADAEEFRSRLAELVETYEDRASDDGVWMSFTTVLAPSAGIVGQDRNDA